MPLSSEGAVPTTMACGEILGVNVDIAIYYYVIHALYYVIYYPDVVTLRSGDDGRRALEARAAVERPPGPLDDPSFPPSSKVEHPPDQEERYNHHPAPLFDWPEDFPKEMRVRPLREQLIEHRLGPLRFEISAKSV
eukprot:762492-Pyramimonas_sp.AAC.1